MCTLLERIVLLWYYDFPERSGIKNCAEGGLRDVLTRA
ncbi:hypothetical protein DOT_3060 [Desulfosporosinus sp. OT]|nr:hypothetical protein DOT_3060 [Desulfosporosinus sp. OT]